MSVITREEALKTLLEQPVHETDSEWRARIEKKLDFLLSVLVVQQKDFCEATGISPDTLRQKVLAGEMEVYQRDGSRLNFLEIKQAGEMKVRKNSRRRR